MSELQGRPIRITSPPILVVDDELSIVKLCAGILEQAAFTVLQAGGGVLKP